MSRGEGMILGFIDFHIFIRDPCGRAIAADGLFDQYLSDQVVHAQSGGQDHAGLAVSAGDQKGDHKGDQPDESAGARVGEQHHDPVQHGTVDLRHPFEHAFVHFTQFMKHNLLRNQIIARHGCVAVVLTDRVLVIAKENPSARLGHLP